MKIVNLEAAQIPFAAKLWEEGWHDAHRQIVPASLTALRTSESFVRRLHDCLDQTRVGLAGDEVLGLCVTKDDELYQMYVSPKARGTGLAQQLLSDGERRMKDAGHRLVWLACAVKNDRAARFYEKCGWRNCGEELVTLGGGFDFIVWRFEKDLYPD